MIFKKRCQVSGVGCFGLRVTSLTGRCSERRDLSSALCYLTPETWHLKPFFILWTGGVSQFCEAGNFSGGRSFVNHPFFCCFIKCGLNRTDFGRHIFAWGFSSGWSNVFDDRFNSGFDWFITQTPQFVLSSAFYRWFVICQRWVVLSWNYLKSYKY